MNNPFDLGTPAVPGYKTKSANANDATPMATHKVEEMARRISPKTIIKHEDGHMISYHADFSELAEVLCEMEGRIAKAPIEHCGVEDCPECNKAAYKSGYLAALEDVRSSLPDDLPRGSMIGYDRLIEVLDELKKKI